MIRSALRAWFGSSDPQEERARTLWVEQKLNERWKKHLNRQAELEGARIQAQGTELNLFAKSVQTQLLLSWHWKSPPEHKQAAWVARLGQLVDGIYQPNSSSRAQSERVVAADRRGQSHNGKMKIELTPAQHSPTRQASGTLKSAGRTLVLSSDEAEHLLEQWQQALSMRLTPSHFTQPRPSSFDSQHRLELEAKWASGERTLNDPLEGRELADALYRDRLEDEEREEWAEQSRRDRKERAQPQSTRAATPVATSNDDDRRGGGTGGWNASGTSYIGGSGNPYDSWSP